MSATGAPCDKPLLEYAYGELPPSEVAELERHLDGCGPCRAELAAVGGVRRVMAGLGQEPAPEAGLDSLLAYAEQAARRAAQGPAPERTGWRRWFAPLLGASAVAVLALVALPVARQAEVPLPSEVASATKLRAAGAEAPVAAPRSSSEARRNEEDGLGAPPAEAAKPAREAWRKDDDGFGAPPARAARSLASGGGGLAESSGAAVAAEGRAPSGGAGSRSGGQIREAEAGEAMPSRARAEAPVVLPLPSGRNEVRAESLAKQKADKADARGPMFEATASLGGLGLMGGAKGGAEAPAAEADAAPRAQKEEAALAADDAREASAASRFPEAKKKAALDTLERGALREVPVPAAAPAMQVAARAPQPSATGGGRLDALRRAVTEARDAVERRRALQALCSAERAEGVHPAEACERLEHEFPDGGTPSR